MSKKEINKPTREARNTVPCFTITLLDKFGEVNSVQIIKKSRYSPLDAACYVHDFNTKQGAEELQDDTEDYLRKREEKEYEIQQKRHEIRKLDREFEQKMDEKYGDKLVESSRRQENLENLNEGSNSQIGLIGVMKVMDEINSNILEGIKDKQISDGS